MGGSWARQDGFSFGEVLATLAVAGISLSLAVPSLTTAMSNNQRATAVNGLVSTMHTARSEAITRNVQVTVCPSRGGLHCDGAAWNEGWIYFADPDHDRQVGPAEKVLGRSAGPAPLVVSSDEFDQFLAYRPSGRVVTDTGAGNSGTFTFCDSRGAAAARLLVVNATGEPRLANPQPDGHLPHCPGG